MVIIEYSKDHIKQFSKKYKNTENYIKQGLILKTVLMKDPRLKEYI